MEYKKALSLVAVLLEYALNVLEIMSEKEQRDYESLKEKMELRFHILETGRSSGI